MPYRIWYLHISNPSLFLHSAPPTQLSSFGSSGERNEVTAHFLFIHRYFPMIFESSVFSLGDTSLATKLWNVVLCVTPCINQNITLHVWNHTYCTVLVVLVCCRGNAFIFIKKFNRLHGFICFRRYHL